MTKRLSDEEKAKRKAERARKKAGGKKEKAARDLRAIRAANQKPTPPQASVEVQSSLPGTQSQKRMRVESLAQKWLAADDERKRQAALAEEYNRQLVDAMTTIGIDHYHRGGVKVVLTDSTTKAKVKRAKDDASE